ncbi:potassium/proton antiporter [Calothrix sp. PCC 6303]|uniref:potassium/proton antiporter n=1 Tax=Calothrix sp. PCC 6303 TaxID=1170562 RepID=UPI0002A03506|nr:potassium/proton antiporter [Calothrix sp. PCC 6303]AFZ02418.1 potassium/proton antiporter, CPA1 family [Calothrix sp. PCC 6303]
MLSEQLFIIAGVLLLASIFASKAAIKFGIPALLLFLGIGMLAGSEGIGGIYFDDPRLTQLIGTLALTLILFAAGLDTEWQRIRPVFAKGLILATVGVIITAIIVGLFAWFILGSFSSFNVGLQGITWQQGLLLGAIVSSTDAAAVFSILRASNLNLKGNLQPLLELESCSNDPMAVLLTVELVKIIITSNTSPITFGLSLMQQLVVGMILGYGAGRGIVWVLNNLRLSSQGLYPVATLALVLLTSGVTTVVGGNGFLAVYIAGIVMGNYKFTCQETIISFHDGLSWLMQIIMFLVLGLLVFPSQLLPIAWIGLTIALFLIFVARPISVFLCLLPFRLNVREKIFLSWGGLRGAVPIVLATFPLAARISDASQLFNVVFFVVLISVLSQGLSLTPVARWLGLINNP